MGGGVAVEELEGLPAGFDGLVVALGGVYHAGLEEGEVVVELGNGVPVGEVALAAVAGDG